jgi:hypothetical protein
MGAAPSGIRRHSAMTFSERSSPKAVILEFDSNLKKLRRRGNLDGFSQQFTFFKPEQWNPQRGHAHAGHGFPGQSIHVLATAGGAIKKSRPVSASRRDYFCDSIGPVQRPRTEPGLTAGPRFDLAAIYRFFIDVEWHFQHSIVLTAIQL